MSNERPRYRYSPLANGFIRLLLLRPDRQKDALIRCSLFDSPILASRESSHLYEALSYAWGPPKVSPYLINIDGRELPVTRSLHVALSRLRDTLIERVIWADAICINQDDPQERAMQVQSMALIYTKASRVVVWLGEEDEHSTKALQLIHGAADELNSSVSHGRGLDNDGSSVRSLLRRPWFGRAWVRLRPTTAFAIAQLALLQRS